MICIISVIDKAEEELMILYYTGTGNSAYTARRIANAIGDEAADLF